MRKLSCPEVLDQLWEYLDEDARAELVHEVDTHLGSCHHCRVEVDTLRHTILIYRREERVDLPVQLSERLQHALEQAYLDRTGKDEVEGEA